MFFEFDTQTIQDLEIYQKDINSKSIFEVYARTVTKGGKEMMNKLFKTPVSDTEFLHCRKEEINFFYINNHYLKLSSRSIDFIEHYLDIKRSPLHDNIIDAAYNGVMNVISPDGDYWIIVNGINYLVKLFLEFEKFMQEISEINIPSTLQNDFEQVIKFLSWKKIKKILDNPPEDTKDYGYTEINTLDHFFRESHKLQLREVIQIIYKIDVLQTLSLIMKKKGYTLPEYSTGSGEYFEATDAFHPLLPAPIANSFTFHDCNLCFLTGPNMSGKSTFLKTMGILIYLSHLGFPVPAKKLKTSIFDGLFTTINLSDNLNYGYSHYYSEVKRVKDIVLKINSKKKLVIIFDELFRGTNVKDAFDASLAIISSIAKIKNNLFFISSHILEVAENLPDKEKVLFKCFESTLINEKPEYDFKIKEGVSQERIGMVIIRNEKIIDILSEIAEIQSKTGMCRCDDVPMC